VASAGKGQGGRRRASPAARDRLNSLPRQRASPWRGRAPVTVLNRALCDLRPLARGNASRQRLGEPLGAGSADRRWEARAAGDDGETTAQRVHSDRRRSIRLAASSLGHRRPPPPLPRASGEAATVVHFYGREGRRSASWAGGGSAGAVRGN